MRLYEHCKAFSFGASKKASETKEICVVKQQPFWRSFCFLRPTIILHDDNVLHASFSLSSGGGGGGDGREWGRRRLIYTQRVCRAFGGDECRGGIRFIILKTGRSVGVVRSGPRSSVIAEKYYYSRRRLQLCTLFFPFRYHRIITYITDEEAIKKKRTE